jgi:hypothetical protein
MLPPRLHRLLLLQEGEAMNDTRRLDLLHYLLAVFCIVAGITFHVWNKPWWVGDAWLAYGGLLGLLGLLWERRAK